MLREMSVVEQRYQAILAIHEDGLSVTEVAAKVGVSRQTLHGWLSRYAEAGLDGLADRSHRPRSCPHQMAPAVQVRLVELRQLHPTWGPDRLLYRELDQLRSNVVGCSVDTLLCLVSCHASSEGGWQLFDSQSGEDEGQDEPGRCAQRHQRPSLLVCLWHQRVRQ